MDRKQIAAKLRAFVAEELLAGDDRELDENTPLLELGIVDSLGMISLLSFISSMGIDVPDEDVRPDHFRTLGAMLDLLTRLHVAHDVATEHGGA